jgi:hypothetical protein
MVAALGVAGGLRGAGGCSHRGCYVGLAGRGKSVSAKEEEETVEKRPDPKPVRLPKPLRVPDEVYRKPARRCPVRTISSSMRA